MIDLDFKYKNLITYLKKEASFNPEISIVLGSGLGDFADSVKIVKTIPTGDLPSYPPSTISGHKGFIHFAEYANTLYKNLGDAIRNWYTLNEIWCSAFLGYNSGEYAPCIKDFAMAVRASHNLILAHAKVVEAY